MNSNFSNEVYTSSSKIIPGTLLYKMANILIEYNEPLIGYHLKRTTESSEYYIEVIDNLTSFTFARIVNDNGFMYEVKGIYLSIVEKYERLNYAGYFD